ncbi:hypothetical protein PCJ53_29255, partial [Klebsiella pneumoniae]|nr:hypothetical protein [Klebsiella pneumoniae]
QRRRVMLRNADRKPGRIAAHERHEKAASRDKPDRIDKARQGGQADGKAALAGILTDHRLCVSGQRGPVIPRWTFVAITGIVSSVTSFAGAQT